MADRFCICAQEDLANWDLLKRITDSDLSHVKAFCVFRCHGGTAALLIMELDEVFAVCSELSGVSILGVDLVDCLAKPEPLIPFRVDALSGKNLQAFFTGVLVGAALDSSGRLYWWGKTSNELNVVQPPQIVKFKTESSPTFIQVCCGHSFIAALSTEGKVYVWGRLICSTFECEELVTGSLIASLSCGAVHVVMLTSDGCVFTWGSGFDGQRGYLAFSEKDTYTVRKIELPEPCLSLVCGPVSTLMLLKSGEVWACGENSEELGFLGVESKMKKIKIPVRVLLNQKAIRISTAWLSPKPYALYTATVSNYEVYTWGPHFPPKPLKVGCKLIEAFHNNCTPRDMGMIYVEPLNPKDDEMKEGSSSVEVLSPPSSQVTHEGPDLLNRNTNFSLSGLSATSNGGQSAATSSMLKFTAELFGSSRLSDVTFIFENSEFPGHRLFLCSRSQHFRDILDIDLPAVSNPIMDCTAEDPIAFTGLLQYLYTGHHAVRELPQLLELHKLALVFHERLLVEDTIDRIFDLLEPDNVMAVVAKAQAIESPQLVSKCESYVTYISAAKPSIMAKLFMNMVTCHVP